jgi:hypothetical protein
LWTKHSNGTVGQSVFVTIMESNDRAASRFGAALGLDPSAARKLGRIGQPGRPLGAVSAPDRVAGPPIVRLRAIPQNEPAKWSRLGRVDPDDV